MKNCMNVLGFTPEEHGEIIDIVVGILNIGNIRFEEIHVGGVGDQSQVLEETYEYLEKAARWLNIEDPNYLEQVLTNKAIMLPDGEYEIKEVTMQESNELRDSMAKILYERMFNWIIEKVNKAICSKTKSRKSSFIGILDIFGFEIFKHNCFEQL